MNKKLLTLAGLREILVQCHGGENSKKTADPTKALFGPTRKAAMVGSVAERVVRNAHCPVLIVRADPPGETMPGALADARELKSSSRS